LQGCPPQRRARDHPIRLPWLYVPAPVGEVARGAVWRILSACSEPESSEGDPSGGPGLVSADPERQGAGRPGPDAQDVCPRLDQLRLADLLFGTVSDRDEDRWLSRQVVEA